MLALYFSIQLPNAARMFCSCAGDGRWSLVAWGVLLRKTRYFCIVGMKPPVRVVPASISTTIEDPRNRHAVALGRSELPARRRHRGEEADLLRVLLVLRIV